jgi:hypothetical protein
MSGTYILEESAASPWIVPDFNHYLPEDRGSKFLRRVVPIYQTGQRYTPEDYNIKV